MNADGCEWNPAASCEAYDSDEHYKATPATVLVGAAGQWRLCADCAKLLRFVRFRTRKPIVRRTPAT